DKGKAADDQAGQATPIGAPPAAGDLGAKSAAPLARKAGEEPKPDGGGKELPIDPPPDPDPNTDADGYFDSVAISGDELIPRIDFHRSRNNHPPPPALRDFRRQISEVARLIRLVFQNDRELRDRFFKQLHLVADSGAVGSNYSVETGLDNLQ